MKHQNIWASKMIFFLNVYFTVTLMAGLVIFPIEENLRDDLMANINEQG